MKTAWLASAWVVAGLLACGDDTTGAGGGGGAGGAPTTSSTDSSTSSTSATSSSSTGAGGAQPYGTCDKTGDSASTGAGPGDLTCHADYACTGGDLRIESDGAEDGTATSTCLDAAGAVLGTCEEPTGIECEYEASCCHGLVN